LASICSQDICRAERRFDASKGFMNFYDE